MNAFYSLYLLWASFRDSTVPGNQFWITMETSSQFVPSWWVGVGWGCLCRELPFLQSMLQSLGAYDVEVFLFHGDSHVIVLQVYLHIASFCSSTFNHLKPWFHLNTWMPHTFSFARTKSKILKIVILLCGTN